MPRKKNKKSRENPENKKEAKTNALPCNCLESEGRWFCMKTLEDGSLIQCDGPFRTREECEAHFCEQ